MSDTIDIRDFDYLLPDERIAKYPLNNRFESKLLFWNGKEICNTKFTMLKNYLPKNAMLVFNNTKVIRARMMFFKESGAKIEIFCLEPHNPSSYEESLSSKETSEWHCMIGNLKKWKDAPLKTSFIYEGVEHEIYAEKVGTGNNIVRFTWSNKNVSFGELLEILGTIPIPPYLNRKSEELDSTRYQTVYSKKEGSVAAPTAGLHFTKEIIDELYNNNFKIQEVTLHVGAGTFLPVKSENAKQHKMHLEHFCLSLETLTDVLNSIDNIIAVGTTSVRTLESLSVLGYRSIIGEDLNRHVGQWEAYDIPAEYSGAELIGSLVEHLKATGESSISGSTQIMITEGYIFRVISGVVTNFHQPQSTLLLLVSAIVRDNKWKEIYDFALNNEYRFLSYGDSSLLLINKTR